MDYARLAWANTHILEWSSLRECMCVCVCEFVSTVNRGHTPTLHILEDNIANEDGPRFVDTCKQLEIAYSCIQGYVVKKKERK